MDFLPLDYDADGQMEAFALTGRARASETDWFEQAVPWFVCGTGARKLREDSGIYRPFSALATGSRYAATLVMMNGPGSSTLVFEVSDGAVTESGLSGKINSLSPAGGFFGKDDFIGVQDDYSQPPTIGGHAYTAYWFYWDNGFHEYGGIPISAAALRALDGSDGAFSRIEAQQGRITDIFYRANGIININYEGMPAAEGEDAPRCVLTLALRDKRAAILEDFCGTDLGSPLQNAGTYRAAAVGEIAVYPPRFPLEDEKDAAV